MGVSPSLRKGIDEEGNSIVKKNGLIEKSIELLKKENAEKLRSLLIDIEASKSSLLAIIDKGIDFPENEDPFMRFLGLDNKHKIASQIRSVMKSIDGVNFRDRNAPEKWLEGLHGDEVVPTLNQLLTLLNESKNAGNDVAAAIEFVSATLSSYKARLDLVNQSQSDFIDTAMQLADGYDELSNEQIIFLKSILSDTEMTGIQLIKYIEDFINNQEVMSLTDKLFSLDPSTLSADYFTEAVKTLISQIESLLEMGENELLIKLGFDNNALKDSLKKSLDESFGDGDLNFRQLEQLDSSINAMFSNLSLDDLKIINDNFDDIGITAKNSIDTINGKLDDWKTKLTETVKAETFDGLTAGIIAFNNAQTESEKIFCESQIRSILDGIREAAGENIITWEEYEAQLTRANEATQQLAITTPDLEASASNLSSAFAEQAENGELSVKTIISLIDAGYASIFVIDEETGAVTLNSEAYQRLAEAKIDEQIASLSTKRNDIVSEIESEKRAVQELSNSYDILSVGKINEGIASARANMASGTENVKAVDAEIAALEKLRGSIGQVTSGTYGTGGRSSRSDTSSIEKETDLLKDLNSELSKIQSAYKDVEKAIEEYSQTQSISVDTFQSLISHAGEYLGYLIDEQGNLTMTREALNEVTAARIDDLAIQQATELIAKARAASDANDIDALNKLAGASGETAKSKWDLVYADLAALNLSADMNNSLVNQVNMLRQMADAAKRGLGNEGVAGQAKEAKSAVDTLRDSLNAQKNELEDRKSYLESVLRAITKIYDTEIKKLGKVNDLLKERQSLYESQLSAADSAINHIISREINDLQKQLKPLEEALKDIEGQRQAELNALKDQNDEISKQIELQKLQEALAKARDQRTQKVYKEGIGWTFQADQSAVKNAQSALDDKKREIDLENQTKLINELYDQQNQAIQANIDKLNENITAWQEYKTQFDEFLADYKFGIDAKIAADLLGADFEQMILNDRESFFIHFKDTYLATQAEINNITAELEANQARIEMYEMMKEKWGELTSAYQDEVDLQNLTSYMGADYESKLLSGRMDVWQGFKNEYIGLQKEIAKLTEEINKLSVEEAQETSEEISDAAFKTAGNVESASGRIISAANNAINAINKLNSMSVTSSSSGGKSGGGNPVSISMYASGTTSAEKGWALVGEEGPELVKFKGGETVLPADETKKQLISLTDYMSRPDFQPRNVFEQIMSRGGISNIFKNGASNLANSLGNSLIGNNNFIPAIQSSTMNSFHFHGGITIKEPIKDGKGFVDYIINYADNLSKQEANRRY